MASVFLDTSVLVATFYGDHQHHPPSVALFAAQTKSTGCTAAHCFAEFYSVVTGMPGKTRASPDEALLFLSDARERLALVTLDEAEYLSILENASSAGIIGATIYDAIIAQCALKAESQVIYTWKIKHFNRFGDKLAARVRQPPPRATATD